MQKLKFSLFMIAATLTLTALSGCGDEGDTRISDEDALCLKILRNGGTCAGMSVTGTATATTTTTLTTTQTDTSTVTITSTTTSY